MPQCSNVLASVRPNMAEMLRSADFALIVVAFCFCLFINQNHVQHVIRTAKPVGKQLKCPPLPPIIFKLNLVGLFFGKVFLHFRPPHHRRRMAGVAAGGQTYAICMKMPPFALNPPWRTLSGPVQSVASSVKYDSLVRFPSVFCQHPLGGCVAIFTPACHPLSGHLRPQPVTVCVCHPSPAE